MSLHDIEIPTYEQIRDGILKLIDEGKISREDAALVLPELRESEDERIRKEIIHFLYAWRGDSRVEKYIAYLEKQKEQKHLLNFDAISSWLRDHTSRYVNSEYNEFHNCTEYDGTINVERLIADLKVAVDSGTFDVHKQKEQKPALYWHKIKANDYLPCRAYLWKLAYEEENNFMGKCHVDGYLVPNEPVGVGCDTWYLPVEDIKNLPKEEGLDTVSPMKTVEQKPASGNSEKPNNHAEWSEEDEKMRKHIISDLLEFRDCETDEELVSDYEDEIAWLKSLHPQPKQEWSEEEEKVYSRLLKYYENLTHCITTADRYQEIREELNFLKSLRPQPHWKPLPEQLEALMYAIEGKWDMIKPTSYLSRRLEDLYDGLVNTYNVDENSEYIYPEDKK